LRGFGGDLAIPFGAALLAYAPVVFAPLALNDGDTCWHLAANSRSARSSRRILSPMYAFGGYLIFNDVKT
jgi:hypothetical protein